MIKKIFKNKINLLIFLILYIYSLYNFLLFCKIFLGDIFDSQLAIFWDYTALRNLIPGKDIMYPYGLLFYYKNTSVFFSFIYVLLFPVLSTLILLALEKIIKNKLLIYVAFFSFIFFILKYTGIEVFNRYSLLLGISILLSFAYTKRTYISKLHILLFGLLIGFIFSIINDLGLYNIFIFVLFSFFIPIFNRGINVLKTREYYVYQAFGIILFLVGILMGLIPITFFFIKIENLPIVFESSKHLLDFPAYSKTPFLPSLRSAENLFNFTTIIITIFVLSYKKIILRKKSTFLSYIQIGIVTSLFILLMKSVIRSIDIQLTFLSFILYIFLTIEIINFLRHKISTTLLYICFVFALFLIFFTINLRSFNATSIYNFEKVNPNVLQGDIQSLLTRKQNLCLSHNTSNYKKNKTYKAVLDFIKSNKNKPVIFDYLTNPIFYVLLDQRSPFYFEIFASSPFYAQERIIKEINELGVDIVVLNTDMLRVKDNVPDYVRNSFLFKHILNNFQILGEVENFIIFRRIEDKNFDFFADEKLNKVADFKNYLLSVDLGSIPSSEGLYKNKLLGNKVINSKEFTTKDKIIVLRSKNSTKDKKLMIALESNLENTTIEFNNCIKDNPCIINLANVPLFYKDKIINEIKYDSSIIRDLKVLQGLPNGIF